MSKLGKKRWVKPELKRISAGSAENGNTTTISDATGPGNSKS